MIKRPVTSRFRGLNNVADPLRLNLSWLTQADNVDVTDRLQLVRSKGYVRRTTNTALTGAYATKDLQRLYLIDDGSLLQVTSGYGTSVLRTGLSSALTYFEEVNGVVYYTNGVDKGVIEQGGARPWGVPVPTSPGIALSSGSLDRGLYQVVATFVDDRGMESGNSVPVSVYSTGNAALSISNVEQRSGYTTNLYATMPDGTEYYRIGTAVGASFVLGAAVYGLELPFWNINEPRGVIPAHFRGQMYLAEPFLNLDLSQVWVSLPLQYHHFDPSGASIAVPGTIRMLQASAEALIIGTDRAIYAWNGESLTLLAEYGVVPGCNAHTLGKDLYFWSLRGLCAATPFRNLTENTVSVAPGLTAAGMVIEKDGFRRYVVALQKGGESFNRRNT